MKGVFSTPDTSPCSLSDIQTKINVGRHQHSELLARHSTLHSVRHWTHLFQIQRWTLPEIWSRHPTFRPSIIDPLSFTFVA